MAVPHTYPPELQRLIDAVAEWRTAIRGSSSARVAEANIAMHDAAGAFLDFRGAEPELVAEQPKSEEDTRPKVVQMLGNPDGAFALLGEDGSIWTLSYGLDGRTWSRACLPSGLRGGPR